MRRKHLKPIECGEGLQIAVAGARNRSEPFLGLPQKICFAKILREEERPAVKRVKARLRTFTAERLRRDESGERSSKMRRNIFSVNEFEFFAAYNNGTLIRCTHFS